MLNVICETESSVEAAETGETSRDFILRGRDKNPLNIFTVCFFWVPSIDPESDQLLEVQLMTYFSTILNLLC